MAKRKVRITNVARAEGKVVKKALLGKDLVEFTPHALDQMDIRSVTEKQVFLVIEEPQVTDLTVNPPNRRRKRVRREISKYSALDVVYEVKSDRVAIITAMKIRHNKQTKRRGGRR